MPPSMAQDPDPAQDELWREAVRLHGGGDLQAAADIYRRLLANFPLEPRVLNRLTLPAPAECASRAA